MKILTILLICLVLLAGVMFVSIDKGIEVGFSEPYNSNEDYNNPVQQKIIENGNFEEYQKQYLENKYGEINNGN